MYADGHLLLGTGVTVTVNTGYCPFTTQVLTITIKPWTIEH